VNDVVHAFATALDQTVTFGQAYNLCGPTVYSLRELVDAHGRRVLGPRSVVVILSDGLDRGEPEVLAAAMADLRSRVRRLIWLNPLAADARYEPLAGGMRAALPFVDHFAAARDLESLERLVPGRGGAERQRVGAIAEVILERRHAIGPVTPASAQLVQAMIVAGMKTPALLPVADEHHLSLGQADPARDLGVAHPHLVPMRFDVGKILQPDGIATADLVVVAEPEDRLAVGGDHGVGDAELLPRQALGHECAARRMGSAAGARVAIGQTRMHSKHCARRPPEPTDILYQSILLSGSNRASSRSAVFSAASACASSAGTDSYCCVISAQAAMS